MSNTSSGLLNFYDRRHPMYAEKLSHWEFLDATYRGGRDWFDSNLFRYLKEGDSEFADRKKRAYRFNHTKEVVELVLKYLFKAPVSRNADNASSWVNKFWKNSMKNGRGIDQLIKEAALKSSVGGRAAVVVDNNFAPLVDEDGNQVQASESDIDEVKIFSYVVPVVDILDYAWDEDGDGKLLWIKLRERVRDDADPLNSTGLIEERVRLWTRTGWSVYRDVGGAGESRNVEIYDEGVHDLGFVPVHLLDHSVTATPYDAPSLIDDIAYLDRAIANYLSNLDAIIQDQTFSQLAIPTQSINRNDKAYKKVLEMGTKRIFTYDSGQNGGSKPEFISPDPKQAGVILSVVEKIINEIYHTVGLAGERTKQDNAVGIDNSSGVAKAYDFERVNSLLLAKAASCENLENWIVSTVNAWAGNEEVGEDLVTYPKTFDVLRLIDDLVTAEALQKIDAPHALRKEHMRVIVGKIFPQLKKDIRDLILADIEKWKPDAAKKSESQSSDSIAAPSRQGSVTDETYKGGEKTSSAPGKDTA